VDVEGHGGLYLGESAPKVLRGEVAVEFRKEAERPRGRRRPLVDGPAAPVQLDADEEKLWQRLRAKRLELARAPGVPPYVIFHHSPSPEVVPGRRGSLGGRAQTPGVGRSKLERYGPTFLKAIAAADCFSWGRGLPRPAGGR